MILADVFPVFCPRVIVPPPSPWPRAVDHHDIGLSKMWYNNNNNGRRNRDEDCRRAFPNLRIPLPEKSFVREETSFERLAYPESPYKTRSTPLITDPFKGFPHQSAILKAPSFVGHQPNHGESPASGLTSYMSKSPFKSPPTVTAELQLKSYKRELDMRETKLHFTPEKRFCPPLPSQSHDVCNHKTMKMFRKQSNGTQSKKIYTCPQCKYVTDRKNNLKRHISTMHQDCSKVLDCCGIVFRSKALLRDHVSLFHRAGYRCQYCGRNFCRKALLRRHLTVHSGQKDFTCPQCGYATSHKSNLERHRKIHDRKYSMDGDALSEDNDSSEVAVYKQYRGEMSPNSSSAESSFTESPTKQSLPVGFSEEGGICSPGLSFPKNAGRVLTDKLLKTQGNVQLYSLSANQTQQRPEDWQNGSAIPTPAVLDGVSSLRQLSSSVIGHRVSEFFAIPTLLTYKPQEIEPKIEKPQNSSAKIVELTSEEVPNSKSCKLVRQKSASSRLFLTPYKCYDCLAVFSRQRDFDRHRCKPTKHLTSSPPISVMERKSKTLVSTGCGSNRLAPSENREEREILNIPLAAGSTKSQTEDVMSVEYTSSQFRLRKENDESVTKLDAILPIKKRTIDDNKDI